jgi:Putative restriction endonuclease
MSAPLTGDVEEETLYALPPELRPVTDHLVTEDDAPLDNLYADKQKRLLTRPLYSSWSGPEGDDRFLACANAGIYFAASPPPTIADVLLSVGIGACSDMSQKHNRTYFCWEYGKTPEVVIEIVSNQNGRELGLKKERCAWIGIPVYVVWDPFGFISSTQLSVFGRIAGKYVSVSPTWFDFVCLGLRVWHGRFEQVEADWLRWCDRDGVVIPLGEERADQERERADQECQRAEKAVQRLACLEAQLRQHGIEPSNGDQ